MVFKLGCNEFVHGVGKMAEFFGQITFLHKYGKLSFSPENANDECCFLCLWYKMLQCRGLTMLRGKPMRIHRESYKYLYYSRSHNFTFYRIWPSQNSKCVSCVKMALCWVGAFRTKRSLLAYLSLQRLRVAWDFSLYFFTVHVNDIHI